MSSPSGVPHAHRPSEGPAHTAPEPALPLATFAALAGAPPKWCQNALFRTGSSLRYDRSSAFTLGLAYLLQSSWALPLLQALWHAEDLVRRERPAAEGGSKPLECQLADRVGPADGTERLGIVRGSVDLARYRVLFALREAALRAAPPPSRGRPPARRADLTLRSTEADEAARISTSTRTPWATEIDQLSLERLGNSRARPLLGALDLHRARVRFYLAGWPPSRIARLAESVPAKEVDSDALTAIVYEDDAANLSRLAATMTAWRCTIPGARECGYVAFDVPLLYALPRMLLVTPYGVSWFVGASQWGSHAVAQERCRTSVRCGDVAIRLWEGDGLPPWRAARP